MDDSISRQAAIDALNTRARDTFALADGYQYYLGALHDVADDIRRLPSAQPERKKGRWIPCTERMPDIDEDGYTDKVLVSFDHYSGVEICEYRITDGVGRWYAGDTDDSPEDIDLQVTAWMPLPERYEGGDT